MLRVFRIYEVGRDQDGKPLELPPYYAKVQRDAEASYAPVGTGHAGTLTRRASEGV